MRSVSLRLQSLNQKTLTEHHTHGVFYTDSFFDFFLFDLSFDFLFDFDCTLQDKRDFRRILQVRGHLLCLGQYMLQDNGISKDNLNLSSRKR